MKVAGKLELRDESDRPFLRSLSSVYCFVLFTPCLQVKQSLSETGRAVLKAAVPKTL